MPRSDSTFSPAAKVAAKTAAKAKTKGVSKTKAKGKTARPPANKETAESSSKVVKTKTKASIKLGSFESGSFEEGVDLGWHVCYQYKEVEQQQVEHEEQAETGDTAGMQAETAALKLRNKDLKERLNAAIATIEQNKTAALAANSAEEPVGELASVKEELARVQALLLGQPGPGVLETANANLSQTQSALASAEIRVKALETLEVTLRQKLLQAGTTIQGLLDNKK